MMMNPTYRKERLTTLRNDRRMLNCAVFRTNLIWGMLPLVEEYVTENTVMLEVGCHRGVSTELFALYCKKIYAVDPWSLLVDDENDLPVSRPGRKYRKAAHLGAELRYARGSKEEIELEFRNRMSHYDHVEIIKDYSVNAAELFENESLDMVYIDADHSYKAVVEDINTWRPKIKKNGVISGHDFTSKPVRKAISDTLGKVTKTYKDGSWVFLNQH